MKEDIQNYLQTLMFHVTPYPIQTGKKVYGNKTSVKKSKFSEVLGQNVS